MTARCPPFVALLPFLAGACSHRAAAPAPEVLAALAAARSPATWTDLDPAHAGTRLRDPRTGIVFRRVPHGEFRMGSAANPDEGPPHVVEITRDYLLAETEVTVAQWQRWLDEHGGAADTPLATSPPDHPRTHLLFEEAVAFCGCYGYRLPTEAEWERACLGGQDSDRGPWTSTEQLQTVAWFHRNANDGPRPVGTRAANPYGLFDMLGNVWEYCSDYARHGYGSDARVVDPTGPATGLVHVLRGGSWFTLLGLTPTLRLGEEVDPAKRRNGFTGFRPACAVE